ncbi:hypothetical protein O181_038361 [Austropuccinia psidii MF-1]|uniref:Uncharacterized protein n=1 Tax=Austropuccinia psidii MF-1 TaxID=1389203 RepID=A0A9Q3D7V0_9BASI|nr:hypothetical protein [Austropuccinia psidii MF-1]
MGHTPWSVGCGGYWRPPGPKITPEPKFAGASGVPWDHKDSDLPKVAGEVLGAEVVPNSACHPSNTSPSQPPSKRFQSQVIPRTPRTFQPTLGTIPPASPHSSHTMPALNPAVRPSPIQKSRNSPIATSQQLQPVASTSIRREKLSPFPFPAAQVFQHSN